MTYSIEFFGNRAVVTVIASNRSTLISFEGVDFANKAMDFVCAHCMVQMGQIGI